MTDLMLRAYTAPDVPEKGPIPFVAATEGLKRDGKNLIMAGLDLTAYEANPAILWAHNTNMPAIGRAEVAVNGDTLEGEVTFDLDDPFAAAVDSKYRRGFLRAFSAFGIATAPVRRGVFEKSELVEISAVPVGIDPEALTPIAQRAMRHLGHELLDLSDHQAVRRELSTNDKRERLYNLLTERFGGEDTWIWIRDFGDDWVVFEVETPEDGCTTYRLGYTATDDDTVTIDSGDPEEVEVRTEYKPVGTPAAETEEAPASDEEPADETMRGLAAQLEAMGFVRSAPHKDLGPALEQLRDAFPQLQEN